MSAQRPTRMRWRGRLPGLALLFGALTCAVYWDPLFLRRNFGGRDLIAYNLPTERVIHDSYAHGRLPIWNPYVSGGRPLIPNPNAGALYPVRPLLAVVSFPLAMRIFPVLHWALSGIGMILLLQSLGISAAGAWTGAVTFAFSGVAVSENFFPHIQPGMTLLPWILWALHRDFNRSGRKIVVLSILIGLDLLAGDVFTVVLAIACALLWLVIEIEPDRRKSSGFALAVALLLAGLLALPQIIASSLWIPETARAVSGIKLWQVFFFSISPWRLLEFVIPYPFGATWALDPSVVWGTVLFHDRLVGLFATFYAGALPVIALFVTHRERRPGFRFARILLAIGLAVSVVPSLLPAAWGQISSPIALRNPEKFAVAVELAVAILAGCAFDVLRRQVRVPSWTIAVGAVFALGAGLCALAPLAAGQVAATALGSGSTAIPIAARQLPLGLAEGGLLWMATIIAIDLVRAGRAAGLGVLLVTTIPIASNARIAHTFLEDELFAPPPIARQLMRLDPDGHYRTLGESLYLTPSQLSRRSSISDFAAIDYSRENWFEHTHAIWHRGTVFNSDFDSGDLSRVESLRRLSVAAASFQDAAPFFGTFSLRWGVRFRDHQPLPGYHRIGGYGSMDWDQLDGSFPDIRLVSQWREVASALDALAEIPRLRAGEVVVESGSRAQRKSRAGVVNIRGQTPDELVLETQSPDPGLLFVLRAYWSSRRVLVDGAPVDVAPAMLAFSSIRVPAGTHTVIWTEEIPGFSLSRFGPLLFVLAAAVFWIHRRPFILKG